MLFLLLLSWAKLEFRRPGQVRLTNKRSHRAGLGWA